MTLPASPIDTRTEVKSAWAYRPGADPAVVLPAGAMVSHGDHLVAAMWAGDADPRLLLELDCLVPLTVTDTFRCPVCGVAGTITGGVYTVLDEGNFTPITTEDGA